MYVGNCQECNSIRIKQKQRQPMQGGEGQGEVNRGGRKARSSSSKEAAGGGKRGAKASHSQPAGANATHAHAGLPQTLFDTVVHGRLLRASILSWRSKKERAQATHLATSCLESR